MHWKPWRICSTHGGGVCSGFSTSGSSCLGSVQLFLHPMAAVDNLQQTLSGPNIIGSGSLRLGSAYVPAHFTASHVRASFDTVAAPAARTSHNNHGLTTMSIAARTDVADLVILRNDSVHPAVCAAACRDLSTRLAVRDSDMHACHRLGQVIDCLPLMFPRGITVLRM